MNILSQPASLEANAMQSMYRLVSGARFHSARRLGYDGGGDLNMCRRGVIRMTPQFASDIEAGVPGVPTNEYQSLRGALRPSGAE
jgi:hypothetical protein